MDKLPDGTFLGNNPFIPIIAQLGALGAASVAPSATGALVPASASPSLPPCSVPWPGQFERAGNWETKVALVVELYPNRSSAYLRLALDFPAIWLSWSVG